MLGVCIILEHFTFFIFGSRVHGVLPVKVWMIVGQFLKEDPGLGNAEGEYEFG